MPLLLRRSAPSPTVDELAFAARAPPLASSLSSVSESSQRCLIHTNSRSSMRRRSLNSTEASEHSNNEEHDISQEINQSDTASADGEGATDAANARVSGTCTCRVSSRASQGSSKRLSARLDDLAMPADETTCGEQENDTDDNDSCCSHDRESTCVKCDGYRESDSSTTSSRVMIRETQLAALDAEIRNLRKTFTRSVYAKLTSLSRRLGKRGGTQQITAA